MYSICWHFFTILLLGISTQLWAANPTDAPSNPKGHTLRLAIGEEPSEGFDPLLGWSHGSYLLLHSPLLLQDDKLNWQKILVKNYHRSQDGTIWTLELKPNLKFSDGSPLRAEDVAFTYNHAAQSGGKIDMGNFKSARVLTPEKVAIQLKAPQSTFIQVLGSLGIVSAKAYNPKTYAQHPIGAGPYRLVSYQPGQQLIVEANPYYSEAHNDFKRLVFVFLDEDSSYAAAQSGQMDITRIPPSQAVPSSSKLTLWVRDSVENRGIVFPTLPSGQRDPQGNPIGNDVTADVAIRRAINYAIDRKLLANALMRGHAIPAYSAAQGLPWQNPETVFHDGDLKTARNILQQAGWIINSDGVLSKNKLLAKLELWYTSGDSTRRELAQAVRSMVKPLGIDLSLHAGSWEMVERKMHAHPTLFGWGSLDPMELNHHYSSKNAGVGFYNPGFYRNAHVDHYLQQALDAPTEHDALPYWKKVQWDGNTGVSIRGDAPWAWLLNIQHTYLANPCIDLGRGAPEFHGSWSLLTSLANWRWICSQ